MAGEQTPHTYSSPGTYNVVQTVTNASGSVTSSPQTVTATGTTVLPVVRGTSKFANRTTGATSFNIALPSGLVNNDLMVLAVMQRSGSPTITPPTGWTARGSQTGAGSLSIFLYSKVYATGQASPVTVSSSSGGAMGGIIIAFQTGTFNATTPFMFTGQGTYTGVSGAQFTVPSLTTTQTNALQVVLVDLLHGAETGGFLSTSGGSLTASSGAPTGFTLASKLDAVSNAGASEVMLGTTNTNLLGMAITRSLPAAGATATATLNTNSANQWAVCQFIVAPAQTGGGSPAWSPRFAGDPGTDKTYMSWIIEDGATNAYTEFKNEITRLRAITYTGGAANNAREPVLYRLPMSGNYYSSPFGAGSTARTAVAEGRIPFVSWNWDGPTCVDFMADSAEATSFMSTLISDLNGLFTATPSAKVWVNLLQEPDQDQGVRKGFGTKSRRATARAAQRKFVAALRTAGLTRQKVAFVGPLYMPETPAAANADFNNGAVIGDPWWEYYPDFKGYPTGGLTWTDGFNALPVDFYTRYNTTAGQGRVVDIAGQNPYCWHAIGNNPGVSNPAEHIWKDWASDPDGPFTDTIYESHDLFTRGEAQNKLADGHGWALRKVLDNLYGKNFMPIILGEYAFPVAEFEGRQFSGYPDLAVTIAHWNHLAQEHIDYGVVGSFLWRQDFTYDFDGDESEYALGTRFGQQNTITVDGKTYTGGRRADTDLPSASNGRDARRKALASQQDRSFVLHAIRTS